MTEISLSNSKILIPATITAAILCFSPATEYANLPNNCYSIPSFNLQNGYSFKNKYWEETYKFSDIDTEYYEKIETIHKFALTLLKESEDIPAEFAKVIEEDFWEIV